MITDNYIKMCEENEDLQRAWEPADWDRFIYKDDRELGIACVDEEPMNKKTMKEINKKYTYLPTLEQLFEMVGDYKAQISRVFLSIMVMKKYKFDSIRELVLNAVMEIKYKKYWTGEKWVVANE